jgi:hypothetical protein
VTLIVDRELEWLCLQRSLPTRVEGIRIDVSNLGPVPPALKHRTPSNSSEISDLPRQVRCSVAAGLGRRPKP